MEDPLEPDNADSEAPESEPPADPEEAAAEPSPALVRAAEQLAEEGWALVAATDDDEQAEAIHQRLRAGGIDAYLRDVDADPDPDADSSDVPRIQVIVPIEEAASAILELEMAISVREAQADVGQVDRVGELGFEVDDLEIAELNATGGPVYELDELGTDDEVRRFLDVLQGERIRFALDRAANLVVHLNDEVKVDVIIERLFGPDEIGPRGQEHDAAENGTEDVVESPAESSVVVTTVVGAPSPVADSAGRATGEDMTPTISVLSSGPPKWVYLGAAVGLVIVFIVLVL